MGPDICNMVHSFFYKGYLLKKLNKSYITLIPKIPKPSSMLQFRPISLCNAAYKIISKIIVNRLQPIMQEIISPYQNAFAKGRLISNNTFLAA